MLHLAVFIGGTIVGSFINVAIYRLPSIAAAQIGRGAERGLGYLALPLSFCPHCSVPIKPWHNIPILSYLLLRGRCACDRREAIALRYLIVELLGGALALACLIRFGFVWQACAAMLFCWLLLLISWLDWISFRLPTILLQPLLWLGLFVNTSSTSFVSLQTAVLAVIGGYLVMQGISLTLLWLTGKRMLGENDPFLIAAIGAWLGWESLAGVVVIGSLLGAGYGLGIWLARGRRKRDLFFPFGPFLAMGALLCLLQGDNVLYLIF